MTLSNTERQRIWRERHRGEPRGNKVLLDKLAALEARVVQLEAELAGRPQPPARKLPGRQDAALRAERDELAERLARIAAYDPTVEAKAAAWISEVDRPPRRRKR